MRIVIVGNGIAGSTAARYIRKRSDHEIIMISGESAHPFSRTALMYVYMGHLRYQDTKLYEDFFWPKNRIQLIHDWLTQVDTREKKVVLQAHEPVPYDKLILATGSRSNRFDWPGQNLHGVQGLYSLQDLEALEGWSASTRQAVVVGGGLIGIELAEMLQSRGIHVTMLVREDNYWDNVLPKEEAQLIDRHIEAHHISLRLSTQLQRIVGDEEGRVKEVVTDSGEVIPCQWVGLAVGVHPNIELAQSIGLACNKGVLVDDYLQTSHPDIYAIGDCAELRQPPPGRKAIEPVWYTGKLMGKTVARTLATTPTPYRPGIWYNSAKFFDIEYQVYGTIPSRPATESTLLWQDVHHWQSIRLQFDAAPPHALQGINVLGVRIRHDVADKMIREAWPLSKVMTHWAALYFDPEMSRSLTPALLKAYREQFPNAPIVPKRKRQLRHLLFFKP